MTDDSLLPLSEFAGVTSALDLSAMLLGLERELLDYPDRWANGDLGSFLVALGKALDDLEFLVGESSSKAPASWSLFAFLYDAVYEISPLRRSSTT
jgi:hypothetical protein